MSASMSRQFCCDCIPTQNRCSTETCACLAARRICDEHCESGKYRGDCLNQAICKCSCEVRRVLWGGGGIMGLSMGREMFYKVIVMEHRVFWG
jgi:hypothetical protein